MNKFIYEFLPIAIFFIVYKVTSNIYTATTVLIVATVCQVAYEWFTTKKVEKSRMIGLALIVVLGGATVLFHNDNFIKWKVTAINVLFAVVLYASHFIGNKTLIERMMGNVITLPAQIWIKLSYYWIAFFMLSAILNIYFAFYYGAGSLTYDERTDVWVNFKFYGLMGLTLVFMLFQVLFLHKHMQLEERNTESIKEN